MKAYIVIEWNGQTYEDAQDTVVAVYLDAAKAAEAVKAFNDSRLSEKHPDILSEQEWLCSMHDDEDYDSYLMSMDTEWVYCEKDKKQHIQEIEITE